jgi:hypothetical protein
VTPSFAALAAAITAALLTADRRSLAACRAMRRARLAARTRQA